MLLWLCYSPADTNKSNLNTSEETARKLQRIDLAFGENRF